MKQTTDRIKPAVVHFQLVRHTLATEDKPASTFEHPSRAFALSYMPRCANAEGRSPILSLDEASAAAISENGDTLVEYSVRITTHEGAADLKLRLKGARFHDKAQRGQVEASATLTPISQTMSTLTVKVALLGVNKSDISDVCDALDERTRVDGSAMKDIERKTERAREAGRSLKRAQLIAGRAKRWGLTNPIEAIEASISPDFEDLDAFRLASLASANVPTEQTTQEGAQTTQEGAQTTQEGAQTTQEGAQTTQEGAQATIGQ